MSKDTTDAVEFSPALIVDGEALVDEYSGWYAINPRACLGQHACHRHKAVTVSIRLDDRHKRLRLAHAAKIAADGSQINVAQRR